MMANQEQLALLKRDVKRWNQWRTEHLETSPDLVGGSLSGADLSGANLTDANLSNADLNNTNLNFADLSGSNLRGTDLSNADLSGANLSSADLSDANLSSADLHNTSLSHAEMRNTDLSNANLSYAKLSSVSLHGANLQGVFVWETIFTQVDLREVKGLTEIEHGGPSCIELQTIRLPQDGSAFRFLRGAGVPEEWIDDYRAHMMHPIQYHSCFISYASKDEMLARRLHADLQASGVRCWFAPEDLKIGNKFRQRIDEAIHLQDKLLLLLSEYSIASIWVENEVEAALEKEDRQQREVLFPIRLDDAVMQTPLAWAAMLRRTRHIGNFTNWTKPEAYQSAFDQLLRDLKQS
jgi:hypothetical protein